MSASLHSYRLTRKFILGHNLAALSRERIREAAIKSNADSMSSFIRNTILQEIERLETDTDPVVSTKRHDTTMTKRIVVQFGAADMFRISVAAEVIGIYARATFCRDVIRRALTDPSDMYAKVTPGRPFDQKFERSVSILVTSSMFAKVNEAVGTCDAPTTAGFVRRLIENEVKRLETVSKPERVPQHQKIVMWINPTDIDRIKQAVIKSNTASMSDFIRQILVAEIERLLEACTTDSQWRAGRQAGVA